MVKAADGRPVGLLIGQPREGGCFSARLPTGKLNTSSTLSLQLSGFE